MENSKDTSVKIGFVQKIGEGEFETETIWCEVDGENFVVDNIPFVAKGISSGDIISAEYDTDDEMYYFEDIIKTSGNSTVRIMFYDDKDIEPTREWLNKNNCESEGFPKRSMIAVNIPKEVDYKPIKTFLDSGENDGKWTYEESCLEHEY